ncbi:serine/threonine-protein kinase PknD [bacterium BMS3Abin10]|nr:serine/threonine-protein kinase PknD [bacterium BMS3Abin10]GBE39694.1 serine/threonine-protein kinase PknD [bacterium BMS3Bbin08]HDH50235.1 6-bladed beta-propeller [Nitrospirota bacterium]
MIKKLILYQSAVLFLVSILISGCAGKSAKDVELYWPLPPDEPRIKWVGWIRGEQDVREETAGEKFLKAVLGEESRFTRLKKPYGVHARDGRIYVSDTLAGKVAVFDLAKKKFFYLGTSGAGVLSKPIGIATDAAGYIYVTDTNQDRAIVYEHNGTFSHALGEKDQFEQPGGIAVNDTLNRIYVVDIKRHHVQVFNRQGQYLFQFGKRGPEDGEFNFPINIFIDNEGKVYVSDSMNFRVQMFDADGNFLSKFGSLGDAPSQFARPKGVAVDSEGHIYVVDAAFNNVQIFDSEGQLLLFFGEMGTGPGGFWLPAGMFIDENDKIYVADQYNRRINIFQYMGEKYRKSLEQAEEAEQ